MPEFTPSQTDAIAWRALDACVIAGPGSGKTTVLVERYRALIELRRFEPREILAITFTEKAAANMRAKLADLFANEPERLRDLESAWVSTIDGFCARLLRENAIAAGIDPRFSVLDARESEELRYECLYAALDEFVSRRRDDALDLIEILPAPGFIAGQLLDVYDAIRSAGKDIADVRAMPGSKQPVRPADLAARLRGSLAQWPANLSAKRTEQRDELLAWAPLLAEADPARFPDFMRLMEQCPLDFGRVPPDNKPSLRELQSDLAALTACAVDLHFAPFRAMIFDIFQRFEEIYRDRKTAIGQLDFNDLGRRAIELLRNDEVGRQVRSQFRQVMLDEFQDINEQQDKLIGLLRGDDVFFAVGDINQSIYGFRHAKPEIFENYQLQIESGGKHFAELLHNFRSRAGILVFVEALLNTAKGIRARQLVAAADFAPKSEPSVEVLRVSADEKETATAREARWIAHRVLLLRGTLDLSGHRKADFKDFAVLCRNSESMRPILDEFDAQGIPYVSGRRQSFLLSREGLDITALLETIANPRNEIALVTVLRSALVGVSDEALLRLRLMASSLASGLSSFAHDPVKATDFAPDDAGKLERFTRNLKRWRAEQPVIPLEVLIVRMLSECGFEWLPDTPAAANIESFLRLARAKGDDRTLLAFLREIESLKDAVNSESDLSDRDQGNRVQVMTAHSAKGLEFPVVIIAAMEKGTQRGSAPVTFTPQCGLGLRWKNPFGRKEKDTLDDSAHVRNSDLLEIREDHEENRLLYVAMTRAAEHLILSYAVADRKPSNWAKKIEEFIQLNPPDVLARAVTEDPPAVAAHVASGPAASGIIAVPRPPVGRQPESAVNVTSLALFAACPRKYYIGRYIGWNGSRFQRFDPEDLPDDAPDTPAAELGSMVHEILAGKGEAADPEARRLADVFLRSDLGTRAAASARAAREWDFIVDVEGMLVRGTVDLWFEENGEMNLVDYKTDDVDAAACAARAADYAPQLALYALAIERAFGRRPAHAWLHFLRPDRLVGIPTDATALRRAVELVGELRDAQSTLRFDLREGEHCRSCSFYRSLCPAGL
jgi:ATP-dependent exoDNAse (exonuclease V) beta subunit